jgi:SAM-dependent methyltransferase
MNEDYYNALAPYYKLIYPNWDASVEQQAAALDGVIREFWADNVHTILDAACGIGTQSIGLAQLGYTVVASDISSAAIQLARAEASKRKLDIAFCIGDMLQLWRIHQRQFDIVIACDNAVPHLLSDADILSALEQFNQCTRQGGGCIISAHDYAKMNRSQKRLYPRVPHETSDHRTVMLDLWKFDGDFHETTTYVVEDQGQATAQTRVIRGGRCYCVTIAKIEALVAQAGFSEVRTLRDRFFQPLVIGIKG